MSHRDCPIVLRVTCHIPDIKKTGTPVEREARRSVGQCVNPYVCVLMYVCVCVCVWGGKLKFYNYRGSNSHGLNSNLIRSVFPGDDETSGVLRRKTNRPRENRP